MASSSATRLTHDKHDRGDTLVEILVAIVIIGLTCTAILGAFATAIAGSAIHRTASNLDSVLRNAASSGVYEIQSSPSPGYLDCAMPSTYRVLSPYPDSAAVNSTVTIFGTSFTPLSSLSVTLRTSTGQNLSLVPTGGGTSSATGAVAMTVVIPPTASSGSATLVVTDSSALRATSPFTVSSGSAVSVALTGYSLVLTQVQYWTDSGGTVGFESSPCPHTNSPQSITEQLTSPSGSSSSMTYVVMDPAYAP